MRQDDGQINLFEQIEEKSAEDTAFQRKQAQYDKWLSLPDAVPVPHGSADRADIASILSEGYCSLYRGAYHECETKPDNIEIWLNHIYDDYWVMHEKDFAQGERVKLCPYCGAKLAEGEGNAVLRKGEPKHWLFFLHFDIPMRTQGYQTQADKDAIKAFWG